MNPWRSKLEEFVEEFGRRHSKMKDQILSPRKYIGKKANSLKLGIFHQRMKNAIKCIYTEALSVIYKFEMVMTEHDSNELLLNSKICTMTLFDLERSLLDRMDTIEHKTQH